MTNRRLKKLPRQAVICLLAVALLSTTIVLQAESAKKPEFDRSLIQAFQGQALPNSLDKLELPSRLKNGRLDVMIELEAPPTTVVFAQAQAEKGLTKARATVEAQTHLAKVEVAQQEILSVLAGSFNVQVLFSLQRTYNGIAAQIDVTEIQQLRQLPGVKAVHFLPEHFPTNSTSVPFLGTPGVWEALGLDGTGVTVGVIDTGVDYLHTNFGGSGDADDYADNDTTVLDGFFPTAKVVGGFDFAGDNYHAGDPANNIPAPDEDPLDCNGHGSHVSGSATGLGVNQDGTTFAGPYDSNIAFDDLRIGPGTAPGAALYALRVFGCVGSTILTSQAIEWAADPDGDGDFSDHLDVINMSLGSNFGSTLDASAQAAQNAALAGVIVVASAGNAGDTYFITGSPGVSGRTISVAASVDDGLVAARTRVNSPAEIAADYTVGTAGFGPALDAAGVTGDVAAALDADDDGGTTTDGCSPLTNPAEVAGKIALIDRGTCNFTDKVQNAQDAGAIAVIVVNNQGDFAFNLGGSDPAITIPSVGIAQNVGDLIRSTLGAGVNATLLLIGTPERADTLASFSSRGPARGETTYLKPDIAAPGLSITSSLVGSGTGTLTISGTSMASPHIAGIMALLRQAHPGWTVEELKALAMNTANNDVFFGSNLAPPVFGGGRVGAGRVDPVSAASNDVIAYNADGSGRVSVSFHTQTVTAAATEDQIVRIANKGADDVTLDLSMALLSDIFGVEFSLPDGDQVTVPAGGTADITVRMSADPSLMLHLLDPTVSLVQNGFGRHWLSEESANLMMTSGGAELRLPLYATPRPASEVRSLRRFINQQHRFLLMRGDGVDTTALAAPPFGDLSLLSAFELQHISQDDPGTQGFTNSADLAYVGVASDALSVGALGGGVADSSVYFGLATHGNYATPTETAFQIFIDTNEDSTPDYLLFNGNFGSAIGAGSDDVFITLLADLTTGSLFLADFINGISAAFNTVLYNNSVMVLPVPAGLIGLSEGDTSFDYFVFTGSRETGTSDITPVLSYDIANPGIDFSDALNRSGVCPCPGPTLWVAEGGTGIPMQINVANLRANQSLGALVLQHHNADPASRAQTIVLGDRLVRDEPELIQDLRPNGFAYFFIDLPNGTNGGPLEVSTSGGVGDIDLYLRHGLPPTFDAFDMRSANIGTDESVIIDSADPGRYYIGLLAKGGYAGVTLTLDLAP